MLGGKEGGKRGERGGKEGGVVWCAVCYYWNSVLLDRTHLPNEFTIPCRKFIDSNGGALTQVKGKLKTGELSKHASRRSITSLPSLNTPRLSSFFSFLLGHGGQARDDIRFAIGILSTFIKLIYSTSKAMCPPLKIYPPSPLSSFCP